MAQKSIMFKMSDAEEVDEIMSAIKKSGQTPANFLRQACGLPIKKQGARYDLKATKLFYCIKQWVERDGENGIVKISLKHKKEIGFTKVEFALAITELVTQKYIEPVGELTDMKFKIVAKNKKGKAE